MKTEWEDSKDTVVGDCSECGRGGLKVQLLEDPLLAEICPDELVLRTFWCLPCWRKRRSALDE